MNTVRAAAAAARDLPGKSCERAEINGDNAGEKIKMGQESLTELHWRLRSPWRTQVQAAFGDDVAAKPGMVLPRSDLTPVTSFRRRRPLGAKAGMLMLREPRFAAFPSLCTRRGTVKSGRLAWADRGDVNCGSAPEMTTKG